MCLNFPCRVWFGNGSFEISGKNSEEHAKKSLSFSNCKQLEIRLQVNCIFLTENGLSDAGKALYFECKFRLRNFTYKSCNGFNILYVLSTAVGRRHSRDIIRSWFAIDVCPVFLQPCCLLSPRGQNTRICMNFNQYCSAFALFMTCLLAM